MLLGGVGRHKAHFERVTRPIQEQFLALAVQPCAIRVRYRVIESKAVDVQLRDCSCITAVSEGSISAVQAALPDCECSSGTARPGTQLRMSS